MSPRLPVADDGSPVPEAGQLWRAESRVGTVVGRRYRLDRLIGRGGSGATFASHDLQLARNVAVKLMLPRDADRQNDNVRFMQEARIASGLRHPHIVDIFDVGVDEQGLPFLVMELLEGHTLQHELKERKTLTPREAFAWLLPIMGAVAFAHDRGIVHRDLKPDNIFLARDASGRTVPQLLDFGVAKSTDGATLTRSGTVVGTPAFMSPEQALDEPLGPPTDVWSLAVVWFRALSGQLPFEGDGLTSVLLKIVSTPAPTLATCAPTLPRLLALAIDRALRRDQASRYPTVRDFARALLTAAIDAGIELPRDPEPVGLPDFAQWREKLEADPGTVRTPRVSMPVAAPAPVTASTTVNSKVSSETTRGGSLRPLLVVSALLLMLGVAYAWLSSGEAPTPAKPPANAALLGRPAPLTRPGTSVAPSVPRTAPETVSPSPRPAQAEADAAPPTEPKRSQLLPAPEKTDAPRKAARGARRRASRTDTPAAPAPREDTIELQDAWR